MDKTAYTVNVIITESQILRTEVEGYGTYSTAIAGLRALTVTEAERVEIIAGNGQRVIYHHARMQTLNAVDLLLYDYRE